MSSLTPGEHLIIGGISGVIEVCIMQPTVALKNALQEGRSIPLNPRVLYRGFVINASTFFPITASQFGTVRLLEQFVKSVTKKELSKTVIIGNAAASGALSSLLSCPAEQIMIQQQRTGRSLSAEARHFLSHYGFSRLYHGLAMQAARESIYTVGYLGICPVIEDYLKQQEYMKVYPAGTSMIVGGITGGLTATLLSHPFDTVKTRMQAFIDPKLYPQYRTTLSSFKHVYETEGLRTFFNGLVPRGVRIVGATFILQGCRKVLIPAWEDYKGSD